MPPGRRRATAAAGPLALIPDGRIASRPRLLVRPHPAVLP